MLSGPSMARRSPWRRVAGPAKAVAATLQRLQWSWHQPFTFVDDLGDAFDYLKFSPKVLRDAVYQSVRRWRLRRLAHKWSALTSGIEQGNLLVPCVNELGPFFSGKAQSHSLVPRWGPSCAPYLRSAFAGGQWPQARRASVRKWAADSRCQLCLTETGTDEHRFVCTATRPGEGWSLASGIVDNLRAQCSDERWRFLKVRGLLVVSVPPPIRVQAPCFRWITAQPDLTRTDVVWYIDGSVVDRAFPDLTTAAAAVVIVGSDGLLAAVGEAFLPAWVRTFGAAEAQGLLLSVSMSVSPPTVVTDCLSLLDSARSGPAAVAANRPLAGVWNLIGEATDGHTRQMVEEGRLIWMPSHVAKRSCSRHYRSDGAQVSLADWRANRLVDAVARRCAYAGAAPRSTIAAATAASQAAAAVAATLGAVTRAANSHPVERVTASGATVLTHRRDSVTVPPQPSDAPKRPWRKRVPRPPKQPKALVDRAPRAPAGTALPQEPRRRCCQACSLCCRRCHRRLGT